MTHFAHSSALSRTNVSSQVQNTPKPTRSFLNGVLMSIFSGLALFLSHPTPGLWPLAWVGLAPLLVCIAEARTVRQAIAFGYLFGWAYLAPTWYWTGLTIVGWTGSPVGWTALVLLTILAACFYAAWSGAIRWIAGRDTRLLPAIVLASSWVVMEWLRSVGSLSFPWAQIGYTQYRFLPVIQISELTGALGVSWLLVLFNAALAGWWQRRTHPRAGRAVLASAAVIALIGCAGTARMHLIRGGAVLRVALMQGNFNYRSAEDTTPAKYQAFQWLTQAAYASQPAHPDLYVWAESAAPSDALHNPIARGFLQGLSDRYNASILTGSRVVQATDESETNSALLFTPGAALPQRFDKIGIVPFGEYIPFRKQIPEELQRRFQFFSGDITPGGAQPPMQLEGAAAGRVLLGPFICYESVYPHYARIMTLHGAGILATPSHDQWFQSEAAMEQHLAIVAFRAVENRRDVVRATTDGITAVIDARGAVTTRAPLYRQCFLVRQVPLRTEITLYTRCGDWFVGACGIVLFLATARLRTSQRRERDEEPPR